MNIKRIAAIVGMTSLLLTGVATEAPAAKAKKSGRVSIEDQLRTAAEKGDLNRIKALVGKGARVNSTGPKGVTAIHLAAGNGHVAVVRFLIEKKAAIDPRAAMTIMFLNDEGLTPLHCALLNRHDAVAQILVEKGADVTARPKSGESVFNMACFSNSAWLIERLIRKGTDVNAAVSGGYWSGWSPLYIAAVHDSLDAAALLLKHGANPNFRDEKGRTILMRVAENGNTETAKLLIEGGADVNAKNEKGDFFMSAGLTPLHIAAMNGHEDVVKLLIANGANLNALDANGNTPKDVAKREDIEAIIAAAGGKGNPGWELFRAVERNDYDTAAALLASGADPNFASNRQGYHSLIPAVLNGNEKMARLLIEKGVNVNHLAADGESALHKAVLISNTDLVTLLIDKGANVNIPNGGVMYPGDTPLHYAARFNSSEMVSLLIKLRADVNAVNRNGETPLDCTEDEAIQKILIGAGGKHGRDAAK